MKSRSTTDSTNHTPGAIDIPLRLASFVFLIIIFLNATEVFTRFGVTTQFWLLIYAGSAFFIAIEYKQVLSLIRMTWPVFFLSIFALLSSFWSLDPVRSVYASAQLIITTIIAIWIASHFSYMTIFRSLLIATSFGILGSVLNDYVAFLPAAIDAAGSERVYSGIYNQKNVYGKTLDLATLSILVVGIYKHKLAPAYLISFLLIIPLLKTGSSGSLLIYLMTLLLPLFWYLSMYSRSKGLLLLAIGVIGLVLLFIVLLLDLHVVDNILRGLGKDTTLTGRTQLWGVGIEIFNQYPLTGVGYQAFWQEGLFHEVEEIRAMFYGQKINGFHSAYIEVLVALGIIGLYFFLSLLIMTAVNTLRWYLIQPNIETLGVLFLVVSTIIASFFDVIVFRQHEIFYLLIIASYASAKKQSTDLSSAQPN